MVVWLIGMSGSGKTTISKILYNKLKLKYTNLVLLDGDILREVWGNNPGYTIEGRKVNAQRISHLCKMLDEQEIHVIASVLSIFPEWQKWNKNNFSEYFEVFLDAPLELLIKRDSKGLYSKALSGELNNVVGIDIDFPTPPNPDLVISGKQIYQLPEKIAERILTHKKFNL